VRGAGPELGAIGVSSDSDVARVSLVVRDEDHPGVTALTFETLAAAASTSR